MHPILTQGLLPTKGGGTPPASGTDENVSKMLIDRSATSEETGLSFIAVLTGPSVTPDAEIVDAALLPLPEVKDTSDGDTLEEAAAIVENGGVLPPDRLKAQDANSFPFSSALPARTPEQPVEVGPPQNGDARPTDANQLGKPAVDLKIEPSSLRLVNVKKPETLLQTDTMRRQAMGQQQRILEPAAGAHIPPSPPAESNPSQGEKPPVLPNAAVAAKGPVFPQPAMPKAPSFNEFSASPARHAFPHRRSLPNAALTGPNIGLAGPAAAVSGATLPLASGTRVIATPAKSTAEKATPDRALSTSSVFPSSTKGQQIKPPPAINLPTVVPAAPPQPTFDRDVSKSLTSLTETDAVFAMRGETATASTAHATQVPQTSTPLPQHIARQIVEALQSMPNRPVEISLNPEELGRVRLALSSSETGIVVNVLAERQETVDLLRRHISHLEAAFLDIGYADIAFSFSGGAQTREDTESDHGASNAPDDDTSFNDRATPAAQINLNTGLQAGLDIRL